ncbi:hypothetical protein LJB42_004880 [Komagataella kurtzmanii]|nr:hypothetical protein LJB42_004880 [Komagataella kurtzmanii]
MIERIRDLTASWNGSKLILKWRICDVISLVIIIVLNFIFHRAKPFQRQFTINDPTLSHPLVEIERVSGTMCWVYAMFIPFGFIGIVCLVVTERQSAAHMAFISLLGLTSSVFTTSFITGILKGWIGRCRPDFLERCLPSETALEDVWYEAPDVCTTDDLAALYDGFKTTPSGHSSVSFAGLSYSAFWLAGQLGAGVEGSDTWKSWVSSMPLFGACYIALSRTQDYRHHFVDVIIGAIIGTVFAYTYYRKYFPGLRSEASNIPMILEQFKNTEPSTLEEEAPDFELQELP